MCIFCMKIGRMLVDVRTYVCQSLFRLHFHLFICTHFHWYMCMARMLGPSLLLHRYYYGSAVIFFHFCPFEILYFTNAYMCVCDVCAMCICESVLKEKWLRLQQKQQQQWEMENKFVTIAHLQQIPELCSLIKASSNSSSRKKQQQLQRRPLAFDLPSHSHIRFNAPIAFFFPPPRTHSPYLALCA